MGGLFSSFYFKTVRSIECYIPYTFEPNPPFYHELKNRLKNDIGVEIAEKKFPYKMVIPKTKIEVLLKMQIRLFQPNILSLTLNCSAFPTERNIQELIDLQGSDRHDPFKKIIQCTIGMVETLDHKKYSSEHDYHSKPAIHIFDLCQPDEFQEHIDKNFLKYIGILIREQNYENLRNLATTIEQKNQAHNIKTLHEELLVNKQGLLYLTLTNSKRLQTKFSRAHELYEIAMIIGTYLENYLLLRSYNEDFTDFILYKIRPWLNKPEIIFRQSVSNRYLWELLIEEFQLRNLYQNIIEEPTIIDSLSAKGKYFNQWATAWWDEKDFAYLIAGKLQKATGFQFDFLKDKNLKNLIIEDYAEARNSLQGRNYKATIILCGALIEAILIDILKQKNVSTKKPYDSLVLNDAINEIKAHKLIKNRALLSLLDPLRQYRNMIHPAVVERNKIHPDPSIATIALETVNLLIKELTANPI